MCIVILMTKRKFETRVLKKLSMVIWFSSSFLDVDFDFIGIVYTIKRNKI